RGGGERISGLPAPRPIHSGDSGGAGRGLQRKCRGDYCRSEATLELTSIVMSFRRGEVRNPTVNAAGLSSERTIRATQRVGILGGGGSSPPGRPTYRGGSRSGRAHLWHSGSGERAPALHGR